MDNINSHSGGDSRGEGDGPNYVQMWTEDVLVWPESKYHSNKALGKIWAKCGDF